jgi:hypothetical protein
MPAISAMPRGLTLQDWASQLRIDISDAVPTYQGGDWQEWARSCLAIDVFQKGGAPRPEYYEKWEDWAERVFQALT